MTQEALKRVAEKLRRAGASIPAPQVTGTIEGSVVTGLCIALALVETEIEALADPMREVQRLGQEIEQEPVAWQDTRKTWVDVPLKNVLKEKRTWVGLTDDEIDYLIHLAYTGDEEFVQIIEAKLKEKNLPCIKPEWIGLTEKEHTEIAIECGCLSADWVFYGATVERKVKERNL